jgi:tRNA(Ile)-lysidine synthase
LYPQFFPVVSEFADRIRHTIEGRRMLTTGDRVLVGVSGGADSVCLLLVLKELGFNVSVAHLNHGLRATASDEDEHFTRSLSQKLGVPFFSKKVSIVKASIETEGRERRKEFFADLVSTHGFTKIALAHTRDDRVETFLMNLLRGAGREGLVSMEPVIGNIIRPLVDASRAQIETYLKEQRQQWRTDATNKDTAFARNRLRHDLIPRLAAQFNPNIRETLSRTVEIFEAEDDWMRQVAESALSALISPSPVGRSRREGLCLDANRLAAEPVGLVRRVIRQAIRQTGSDLRDVSFDHIEAARGLLGPGKSGKVVQIPGGTQVGREFDDLVIRHASGPATEYAYKLQIPGEVHIPELGKLFRAEVIGTEGNRTGPGRVLVDAAAIGPCVMIRNWKPGDYYRPVGLPAGKLKKLFQRARIPRSHRRSWPVVVADSTIIWVASFPVSRDFAPDDSSQSLVLIEERESKGCVP